MMVHTALIEPHCREEEYVETPEEEPRGPQQTPAHPRARPTLGFIAQFGPRFHF